MAAALPITLRALAALSTVGTTTGTAVDCERLTTASLPDTDGSPRVPRWAAKLVLDVVEVAAGAVLKVDVETSADQVAWRAVYEGDDIVAPLEEPLELYVGALQRYVRAKFTLGGSGTPSARFGFVGEAHTVYCTPRQLTSDAVPEHSIAGISASDRLRACIVGSTEGEGYLASAYTTPILAWGDDLAEKTALISAAKIFNVRGRDPEGPDKGVFDAAAEARDQWFNRIANGKLKPPGIVDSTPEVFEGGSVVVSSPSRGWR